MKLKSAALALALLVPAAIQAAPPVGDTQGTVSAVRVMLVTASVKSFQVWFSQVQNDRWGCASGGYVTVYDNAYGVTQDTYKQIFALAVLAQATGKPLGLDSAGTNPCTNISMGWVVN